MNRLTTAALLIAISLAGPATLRADDKPAEKKPSSLGSLLDRVGGKDGNLRDKKDGDKGLTVSPAKKVINIPGETYIESDPKEGPGGFWQDGVYYKKTNQQLRGEEYVPGNPSQKGGFWQNGKYYVRKNASGGSGGGNTAGRHVINIPGETYIESNPKDGPGGFWQNGKYYRRHNTYLKGDEYVPGNPSQKGGFWQNGKYYVKKGTGGGSANRHVINIPGETYIESNPSEGSGGFWQNGKYYRRHGEYLKGDEYVPGNPSQKGGFWQNGKYYVKK